MTSADRTCQEVAELLDAFVDTDLSADESRAVSTHLETCEGCRNEADQARRLRQTLREISLPRTPDFLEHRILDEIARRENPPARPLLERCVQSLARVVRPPALAGAAVIALAFVFLLSISIQRDPPESGSTVDSSSDAQRASAYPRNDAEIDPRIARAERDVRAAFALIAHVSENATNEASRSIGERQPFDARLWSPEGSPEGSPDRLPEPLQDERPEVSPERSLEKKG